MEKVAKLQGGRVAKYRREHQYRIEKMEKL